MELWNWSTAPEKKKQLVAVPGPVVIITCVRYLGPPAPFSFPESRDLLEVLGGLSLAEEACVTCFMFMVAVPSSHYYLRLSLTFSDTRLRIRAFCVRRPLCFLGLTLMFSSLLPSLLTLRDYSTLLTLLYSEVQGLCQLWRVGTSM